MFVTLARLPCLDKWRMAGINSPAAHGQVGQPMKAQHDSIRDDIRTMQAAQADLSRFAPIYERYGGRIYQYCLRWVDSPEAAGTVVIAVRFSNDRDS